jgi:hypothetical protein
MRRLVLTLFVAVMFQSLVDAQTPQPFPRPPAQGQGRPAPGTQAPPPATTSQAAPAPPPPVSAQPPSAAAAADTAPTEASLGFAIYPNAQFITSYDAGHGQRYFLFGSGASFPELVKYYQALLKTKGTLVFEAPATHIFEMGRFDEKTMAFPSGVTIKDYTWGGSPGYLNPKRDAQPQRFPTIIQIVPALPGAPR